MSDFEGRTGHQGDPYHDFEEEGTKAKVGPFSVKRCFYGAKAIPEGISTPGAITRRGHGGAMLAKGQR